MEQQTKCPMPRLSICAGFTVSCHQPHFDLDHTIRLEPRAHPHADVGRRQLVVDVIDADRERPPRRLVRLVRIKHRRQDPRQDAAPPAALDHVKNVGKLRRQQHAMPDQHPLATARAAARARYMPGRQKNACAGICGRLRLGHFAFGIASHCSADMPLSARNFAISVSSMRGRGLPMTRPASAHLAFSSS